MNPRTHLPHRLTPLVRPLTLLLLLIVMGSVFTTAGLSVLEAGKRLGDSHLEQVNRFADEA